MGNYIPNINFSSFNKLSKLALLYVYCDILVGIFLIDASLHKKVVNVFVFMYGGMFVYGENSQVSYSTNDRA